MSGESEQFLRIGYCVDADWSDCVHQAVYFDADVILLDDPVCQICFTMQEQRLNQKLQLSAVDAHVSQHLVNECLINGPLRSKTRFLVTHNVRFHSSNRAIQSLTLRSSWMSYPERITSS